MGPPPAKDESLMDAQAKYGPVVTDSVAKQIAQRLREAILDGRLKVGERLPTEEELAQKYGVSRATIREALKRLAAQSLVHARRGPSGGNFVTHPDPDRLAEILTGSTTLLVSMGAFEFDEIVTARLEMEATCCRLAATHRQPDDIQAMRIALDEQKNENLTDQEFCAADIRFHRCLVNATQNGPLRFMMYAVVEAMMPITNMVVFRVRERAIIINHHAAILDAIDQQQPQAAVDALSQLVTYLSERYRETMVKRRANDS
jgi:DNA-binding FadR family transcriptional regulator